MLRVYDIEGHGFCDTLENLRKVRETRANIGILLYENVKEVIA